jgi:serine/threonine protein kinase
VAPEVVLNREYDEKADVYSWAIVAYELLAGVKPFRHLLTRHDFTEQVAVGGQRPPIDARWPQNFGQLLKASLAWLLRGNGVLTGETMLMMTCCVRAGVLAPRPSQAPLHARRGQGADPGGACGKLAGKRRPLPQFLTSAEGLRGGGRASLFPCCSSATSQRTPMLASSGGRCCSGPIPLPCEAESPKSLRQIV